MSEHIFQISGLPRSGTAWIATVLSLSPDVTCYHEALMQGDPETLLRNAPTKYAGDCSTYGFMPKRVIEDAKKVVICRDPCECFVSAENAFKRSIDVLTQNALVRRFDQFFFDDDHGFVAVEFPALFTAQIVKRILEYCCPGATIDPIKLQLALSMNIQRSNPAETFSEEVCAKHREAIWG
jgi:hypothetical protein